jgi:hypothetical protein
MNNIQEKANRVLELLQGDKRLGRYVDQSLPIPKPYCGVGKIRLIVLGQDPTVKDAQARQAIKTVLNLDRNRSVRAYLAGVCKELGIDISENVYATNLYKNFFVRPPTQIAEIDIFQECLGVWLPVLREELDQFEDVPILTLGEPLLGVLVNQGIPNQVKHYWGYTPEWKSGQLLCPHYVKPQDNRLGRLIFPFPHQPSLCKQFYKARMGNYTSFVKAIAFSKPDARADSQRDMEGIVEDTLLSSSTTIARYRQLERDRDRERISDFIWERFWERYIRPLRGDRTQKHGFCTIAVCCLMIESLESFWRGWSDSNRKSEWAFCSFFDRHSNLSDFRGHANDFYKHVRCGILHQAETSNGWRIRRAGPLFDVETKTINATKFHNELEKCLQDYCHTLKHSKWEDEVWENLRRKMNTIIEHCRSES